MALSAITRAVSLGFIWLNHSPFSPPLAKASKAVVFEFPTADPFAVAVRKTGVASGVLQDRARKAGDAWVGGYASLLARAGCAALAFNRAYSRRRAARSRVIGVTGGAHGGSAGRAGDCLTIAARFGGRGQGRNSRGA